MTLADKVTSIRLVLAPVFFVIYLLPRFFSFPGTEMGVIISVAVLWLLFLVSELSDLFDGIVARKRGEVSDFGKLFDPFADTLTQITYFLCFVMDGIFPALLFLLVLYREFSVLFVRNLMLRKGIAMGARMTCKIKTVTYVVAAALALMASSLMRLGLEGIFSYWFSVAARISFIFSVIIALISLFEYISVYLKTPGIEKNQQ